MTFKEISNNSMQFAIKYTNWPVIKLSIITKIKLKN